MPSQSTITWYDSSPDAGHPECICSLGSCGQPIAEDTVPVRVFDNENNREARFHPGCFQDFLTLTNATLPIPFPEGEGAERSSPPEHGGWREDAYNGGLPFYWADETTGLAEAIRAYLNSQATDHQLALAGQYLDYYINAPCWSGGETLDDLRRRAPGLKTAKDISAWLRDCLKICLDPL